MLESSFLILYTTTGQSIPLQGPFVGCSSKQTWRPGISVSRNAQHWVRVFECQWDKASSTEEMKKVNSPYSMGQSRSRFWYPVQRTMKRHWGRNNSKNYGLIYRLIWSKSPLEINWLHVNSITINFACPNNCNQHFHILSLHPFPHLLKILWKTATLPERRGMHRLCWSEHTFWFSFIHPCF